MKTFTFEQTTITVYKIEAETEYAARHILENANDLADYIVDEYTNEPNSPCFEEPEFELVGVEGVTTLNKKPTVRVIGKQKGDQPMATLWLCGNCGKTQSEDAYQIYRRVNAVPDGMSDGVIDTKELCALCLVSKAIELARRIDTPQP